MEWCSRSLRAYQSTVRLRQIGLGFHNDPRRDSSRFATALRTCYPKCFGIHRYTWPKLLLGFVRRSTNCSGLPVCSSGYPPFFFLRFFVLYQAGENPHPRVIAVNDLTIGGQSSQIPGLVELWSGSFFISDGADSTRRAAWRRDLAGLFAFVRMTLIIVSATNRNHGFSRMRRINTEFVEICSICENP
jgi:hypothetical protein